MKLVLALSAVALLATTAISASAAPTEVSHFTGSGDYAYLSSWDNGGSVNLSVYSSGTKQNPSAYMSYYASSCTYSGMSFTCTGTYAYGDIPGKDFQVRGNAGGADLITNTSSLYGWAYSYSCDYSTWTCSFQDLPITDGPINVHWSKNTMYSYSTDSRTESDYINVKISTHNKATYSSANVEGDMLGQSLSGNGYAQVGTSQLNDHVVYKN